MTVYQAKGLEFPIVIVPGPGRARVAQLRRAAATSSRSSSCARAGHPRDFNLDEERRLLYVALTRAQDGLIVTSHGGSAARSWACRRSSRSCAGPARRARRSARRRFIGPESRPDDTARAGIARHPGRTQASSAASPPFAGSCRCRRNANDGWPCACGRPSCVGMLEGDRRAPTPRPRAAPRRFDRPARRGRTIGRDRAPRRRAPSGSTRSPSRTLAQDSAAGANLLQVAPLAGHFSYSQFSTYERCPLQYAFASVYRIPTARSRGLLRLRLGGPRRVRAVHAASDASAWHAASRPRPGRTSRRIFARGVESGRIRRPDDGGRVPAQDRQPPRALLGRRAQHEQRGDPRGARVRADARPGRRQRPRRSSPARSTGSTGCPRAGSRSSTTRPAGSPRQKDVGDNLQLSIYALACRDALGLGTPGAGDPVLHRVVDADEHDPHGRRARRGPADILARAARIRSGDFAATPSRSGPASWCDYAALCPSRVT